MSQNFQKNINTNLIAITGSCGKTTLKELLGNFKKNFKVSISPNLIIINMEFSEFIKLRENDEFGVLEVGMDKKGEIDYLQNHQPDVSIITN